jgi:hypothetical protein
MDELKNDPEIEDLINAVSACTAVECRILLHRCGNEWVLQHMLANINLPESHGPFCYDYGSKAFLRQRVHGEELSAWLANLRGEGSGYSFQIPNLQKRVPNHRYSSNSQNRFFFPFPQPFTLYNLQAAVTMDEVWRNDTFSPLVKAGLPSFPNCTTAGLHLIYGLPYMPGLELPRDPVIIRLAHPEAWIGDVAVKGDSVEITVCGSQVGGTCLTVGGPAGILVTKEFEDEDRCVLEIPSADCGALWLVLSRENKCLDTRRVEGSGVTGHLKGLRVQPDNLYANIQELLLQGEHETLEYKSQLPNEEDKLLKTIAAFANSSGGIVLIGVTDDGRLEGIKEDVHKYKDKIVNKIRNRLTPQPEFAVEHCEIDHRQMIAVLVAEGATPPYGLNDKPPLVYVRRCATTFAASQAEIRALGAKNQSELFASNEPLW